MRRILCPADTLSPAGTWLTTLLSLCSLTRWLVGWLLLSDKRTANIPRGTVLSVLLAGSSSFAVQALLLVQHLHFMLAFATGFFLFRRKQSVVLVRVLEL